MGKLINRIPGSHLLISSLPASRCQQAFSKPCLVNLISKDTHLVFSISNPYTDDGFLKYVLPHIGRRTSDVNFFFFCSDYVI